MFDATTDIQGGGYAASMEEAQSCLRPVFERWLAWALAVPACEYGPLDRNLKAVGVRLVIAEGARQSDRGPCLSFEFIPLDNGPETVQPSYLE